MTEDLMGAGCALLVVTVGIVLVVVKAYQWLVYMEIIPMTVYAFAGYASVAFFFIASVVFLIVAANTLSGVINAWAKMKVFEFENRTRKQTQAEDEYDH